MHFELSNSIHIHSYIYFIMSCLKKFIQIFEFTHPFPPSFIIHRVLVDLPSYMKFYIHIYIDSMEWIWRKLIETLSKIMLLHNFNSYYISIKQVVQVLNAQYLIWLQVSTSIFKAHHPLHQSSITMGIIWQTTWR